MYIKPSFSAVRGGKGTIGSLREEESEVQLSSANAESSARNKNDHLLILPLFHTCTMSLRSEKGRSFTCS